MQTMFHPSPSGSPQFVHTPPRGRGKPVLCVSQLGEHREQAQENGWCFRQEAKRKIAFSLNAPVQ
ncbi:hypothetical protein BaRGS_00038523, partial [Batillaria attramentaria]